MSPKAQSSKGLTGSRVTTTATPWLHYGCTELQKARLEKSAAAHSTPVRSPVTSVKPKKLSKKLSMLAAALQLLQERKVAMTCSEIVDALAKEGLWVSPGGKTPSSTLYAAISRRIRDLGNSSPFRKTERGKFVPA